MAETIMVNGLARKAAIEDVHTVMTNDDNIDYIVELDDNDMTKKVWNVFVPSDNDEEFVVERVEEPPKDVPIKKPTKAKAAKKNVTIVDNLEIEPVVTVKKNGDEKAEKKPKNTVKADEEPEKKPKKTVKAKNADEEKPKKTVKPKNADEKTMVTDTPPKEKVKRGPTAYSEFLSVAMKEAALDKTLDKSQRMKKVQEMWKAKKAEMEAAAA